MGKPETTKFGDWLARTIRRAGHSSPTAFAAAARISPSSVSKWINGKERPSAFNAARAAPHLGVDQAEILARAYPESARADTPAPIDLPPEHPLVTEIARMLADDSPMPARNRDVLEQLLDGVIGPYRQFMRKRVVRR